MKTPIHLWIVGLVSLVWNAGGATDYVLTQIGHPEYTAMLTEAQRAFFAEVPPWFEAAWAIGVWGAVLGSLLLLLRLEVAGTAFAISLIALFFSSIYSMGIAKPSSLDMMTTGQAVFTAAIYVVAILLWVYTRAMGRRGLLR